MAYTTPKTWAVGDVLTAADMNTYVRDNVSFLANPPKVRCYNSGAISTTTATFTKLTFDTNRVNIDTMHSTVSNTSRLTCNTAGFFSIISQAQFPANATGQRYLDIYLNNSTVISATDVVNVGSGATPTLNVATLYQLAAADYVETRAYQDSLGNLNVNAALNYSPEFMAVWTSL